VRLFEVAPSVQPLFANVDMERQRQALLNMLVVVRESLLDLDDIGPDLEDLGARHVGYGAQAEHYPVVGDVLVETMAGSRVTPGNRNTPPRGKRHTESFRT
jgi:hemoglobin-like flavoprotein